jgi:hypothetical protein
MSRLSLSFWLIAARRLLGRRVVSCIGTAGLGFVISLAWFTSASGNDFVFQKISSGWVSDFSMAGGAIAYNDDPWTVGRVHLYHQGVWSDPVGDYPWSTGAAYAGGPVSTDGTSVAWFGIGELGEFGVYRTRNGAVEPIAEWGYFTGAPVLASDRIAFVAGGSLFADLPGQLDVVVGASTPVPGGLGTFSLQEGVGGSTWPKQVQFDFDGQSFAVYNENQHQRGIYTDAGGAWRVVADTNTAIPGGVGNFIGFSVEPAIRHDSVLFAGQGDQGQQGIYRERNGSLERLVDLNTPVPGGGQFLSLNVGHGPALDGESFAFIAEFLPPDGGVDRAGVFGDFGDGLVRVATELDVIDGENLSFYGEVGVAPRVRLDGSTLAFNHFGGNGGIILVTVPEPSTFVLAAFGAVGLVLAVARRTKHRGNTALV